MKPTKHQLDEKFIYNGQHLVYKKDSGRYGRYKAGTRAGSINNQGVRTHPIDGKYYQEHQLIWTMVHGSWPERVIRHKNGNLDDNRLDNLYMDSLARGRRNQRVDVARLRECLDYNPDTGVFTWKISPRNRTLPGDVAGHLNDSGYLICCIDQQQIRLHRAAWAIYYGEMPPKHIDHINRIRSDNRISNLRLASDAENVQNSTLRYNSKTGVKGVNYRKDTNKYSACITVDKKTIYLGCFDTLEEAQAARLEAEIKYHLFRVKV